MLIAFLQVLYMVDQERNFFSCFPQIHLFDNHLVNIHIVDI